MVKRHHHTDPAQWLAHFTALRGDKETALPREAIALYTDTQAELLEHGLGVAGILLDLGLDSEGLACSIIYPLVQQGEIHIDTVAEHLGESSAKLLRDLLQMRSLDKLQQLETRAPHQLENLRKLLLAMVADVRAVLITLAERLWSLRHAAKLSNTEQLDLAKRALEIYAPLANRLGVGHLKWEMEDLCLRYLKPETYKEIAKLLASRREERERYIHEVIELLQHALTDQGLQQFQVTGRVKHIYSIYRKMQRKSAVYSEIYDISAVRVLVPSIADCYAVLGLVHGMWQQIPKEFDDYITNPKPNGYRSIHTAVIGPENRNLEVQIRTYEMHQESELGVAAHWRYKEGGVQQSSYEAKIAWLRQVMEWQKEISSSGDETKKTAQKPQPDLFADRVYIFTPTGDIMDLPQGATPLDFAYQIHSEVGHRCRGAKVDGNIVPLTYQLQTGQRVEILTAKQANPSRDWLNPHLGYLVSQRARNKIQHWFKMQDFDQNVAAGQELLEKELRRLDLPHQIDLAKIAENLNYKSDKDILAAVGSGDIRLAQIMHFIQPPPMPVAPTVITERAPSKKLAAHDIQIVGVGNLLTQIARCCKPLPGEPIIGYITLGRGVSIHRRDCSNILHADEYAKQRLIEVAWGQKISDLYPVDLFIQAYDRHGLLRDITTLLATEKINLLSINTVTDKYAHEAYIDLTIEITSLDLLGRIMDHLQQLSNVISVRRKVQQATSKKK